MMPAIRFTWELSVKIFGGLIIVFLLTAAGCNQPDIPLPQNETGSPQPVNHALPLTAAENFSWSDSFTIIHPDIHSLDLSKLPSAPFNTEGFIAFTHPVETATFALDHARDSVFDYAKLPAQPLRFEMMHIDAPQSIPISKPRLSSHSNQFIYELGEPFPTSAVTKLFTDHDGLLWIATDRAVYRYDGENCILVFRPDAGIIVLGIAEDSRQQIWLGCSRRTRSSYWKGAYMLDLKKQTAKKITLHEGQGDFTFIDIVCDSLNRVWVAAGGNNIDIIDPDNRVVRHFDQQQGLPHGIPNGILCDRDNNIWIGCTQNGGCIINPSQSRMKFLGNAIGLYSDSIRCFSQDPTGDIWIGYLGGPIEHVSLRNKTIRRFTTKQGLIAVTPSSFAVDPDGRLWCATIVNNGTGNDSVLSGIQVIDEQSGTIRKILSHNGIVGSFINSLVIDDRQQVWIGSDNGLNMVQKNGVRLEHIGRDTISSLLEDSKQRVWMGSLYRGFNVGNLSGSVGGLLTTSSGLSNNYIQNITKAGNRIFICSGGGLDIVDSSFSGLVRLNHKNGLPNDSIIAVTQAADGTFWTSFPFTGHKGVFRIDASLHTIRSMHTGKKSSQLNIIDMKTDHNGRVWVSSEKNVWLIDPVASTIRSIDSIRGFYEAYNRVMMVDAFNYAWIGTGEGVFRISPGLDSFWRISEANGLLNNAVLSLNARAGIIYAGTKSGLSIITPPEIAASKKWEITNLDKKDGIVKNANTYSSDLVLGDGRFVWGDIGMTLINKAGDDSTPFRSYIQGINVLNEHLAFSDDPWKDGDAGDTLWSPARDTFYLQGRLPRNASFGNKDAIRWDTVTGMYNLPVNLQLSYDQNYLQFNFGAVTLGTVDTVWYRYILEGVDRKWSDKTYSRFSENYLNLSPGNYTFKLSTRYKNHWQEPVAFSFSIMPPWWKSWWAYCLYGLLFALLITTITRYRSRQLQLENLRLEQKVQERTNELSASLQNLRKTQDQLIQSEKMASLGELTAGIAHEIQNPLNFVNNFSELNTELFSELNEELAKGNYEEVKAIAADINENQKKINYHGKRADAIVKGMLQHSRSSANQKGPTDINMLADEYLRLSYHGLRAKDKSFNAYFFTQFDDSAGTINAIPQDIGRVLLNIFNNAFYSVNEKVKTQPASYQPSVWVTTSRKGGSVVITVRDNGNGIPAKALDKIFQPFFTTKPTGQGTGLGLSMSYDIITKGHGGELKVENQEGEGAQFVITLPVNG